MQLPVLRLHHGQTLTMRSASRNCIYQLCRPPVRFSASFSYAGRNSAKGCIYLSRSPLINAGWLRDRNDLFFRSFADLVRLILFSLVQPPAWEVGL